MSTSTSTLFTATRIDVTVARLADRYCGEPTHATCREAIKAAVADGLLPRKGSPALAARLYEAARAQGGLRRTRRHARSTATTVRLPIRLAAFRAAKERRVKDAVFAARKGLYRVASDAGKYAPQSGHTTTILIGTPAVRGESGKVWGRNYAATASTHTYTVARDWIAAVQDRDLAVVDGMFTVDARPVPGAKGTEELYAAIWAAQGRGCSLNQERGYIARIDDTTYHAATARAALIGVRRKAGGTPAPKRPLNLDRLARRRGNLVVTVQDARDCGLCHSGIQSWCAAVGLDVSRACTLAEVIAGYRLRPLADALKVIRRVIRTQRGRDTTPVPDATVIALRSAVASGDAAAVGALADRLQEVGA